ncbi:hypothetical protein KO533_12050 [Shewanella sp. NKUCC05_KAH]|jgi:hypothetical protein|uniref:Uncharacterized protein n=1 Tax=Shewanella oncorhynchi TaxID=2726434 RepID=A0ABX1KRP4_9GAMM|nr:MULTISPECIES: hypothetical protein [Shewanella]AEH11994.1 hypothetical protein Sbal117_0191 [Shewanella baltica OS117]MBI1674101.1 hypothetical protein [Shewanella sp. DW31]MBW3517125.1 hypothetical protein [Shewanella sp. NKUCC01_JLK]MBW3527289.1 hypothetical protein [Shewanella sp. NKUCC05_KAH]MBW3531849.1 hypothetical protein [Shewanella sp. NKUCC06_TVS]
MAQQLSTGYISGVFGGLVNNADDKVSTFITDHTGSVDKDGKFTPDKDGTLILSASDSLSLQQLMADQSITAQTSTTTLKSIKDSISAAARNI